MENNDSRKIFFTDLDGTLLNDQKQITPEVRRAVHAALDQGHYIVLSTGRTLYATLLQAKKLDLMHPGCYLITFNGAQVYDISSEKLLLSRAIPQPLIRYCFDQAEKYDIHIQAYYKEYVVTEHDRAQIEPYCAVQHLPVKIVPSVDLLLTDGTPKMLVIEDDPEKLARFRSFMEAELQGKVDLFLSASNYLELVSTGTNKGSAVRFLCDHLGISIERSVAAGDMENDITMIRAAGTGAVMCNGTEAMKKIADYVTTNDNNHSGTAEIIEKFILKS